MLANLLVNLNFLLKARYHLKILWIRLGDSARPVNRNHTVCIPNAVQKSYEPTVSTVLSFVLVENLYLNDNITICCMLFVKFSLDRFFLN